MDVTGTFFNKLRTLAVTLEKQAEQFKQILLENEEFEDDSPMRYLHELYSEARMLKADADNILHTSSSERDATYDFIKASKVLMKRNATNLEKIRDLFQKYGYKPLIGKNEGEYFNIYGRDLSVNDETTNLMDDQTIFLLNKSRKNRSARVMVSDQNLAALRQSNEACDYDCFASPATPEFRTPGVKIPHRKTVLSVSPESNHLEIPPLDTKSQHTQPMHVSATKILPDNHLIKDSVQPVLDSDKYLECTEEPSPPATSIHEDLFNSPLPPPEITVIPKNLLQILSRYNPNIDVPRSAVKGTKEENASQFEKKPFLCTDNKENRKYFG
ncbi:spindle and kinetochore-associated protein 3 isoform X2 [Ahaetulla prasina]|uniref:spindle and kinetochore-associated protein 3 isoform X2 n=1 Tax=Ahaetulla prasina TaxID=499056 RepID=UPI002647E39D|nr:spindle and kinetochore-associated protein 3 isoform X2 [Ahaetulla prasina]